MRKKEKKGKDGEAQEEEKDEKGPPQEEIGFKDSIAVKKGSGPLGSDPFLTSKNGV